jgi:hypothetical protein
MNVHTLFSLLNTPRRFRHSSGTCLGSINDSYGVPLLKNTETFASRLARGHELVYVLMLVMARG